MGLQYTYASSYGSGDKHCDRDGNQRCDRCAGNCNQSWGQSGDNFSWETCTGGAKPFDQGGWLYRREISLDQHGSRGCKHRCFSVCSPYLGYEQGAKQSPCTDSNQRKFLGYKWKGGGGWDGNNDNVRVSKFNDSNTALQCQFDVNADNLKYWSNKNYITKAGAKDDNDRFMNQYEQMLWGIRIKDGLEQPTGFCHAGNADTVVHQNGKTCQELAADNFSSLPTSDSRWGVWDTLTDAICSKPENLTKKIKPNSNVTCSTRDTSKALAKQWCSIGKNIVTDSQSFCNPKELGQALYEQLASKYCQANKSDEWCACYNVMTHGENCANNVDLPGCEDVADQIEMMQEDLSAKDLALVKGTEVCWGSCTGSDTDKFIPKEYDKAGVCNRDVSICVSNITAGNLRDSGIRVNQNCGNKGVPDSESSSSGKDGDGDDSALKSSDIKAGVITDTKTAEGIMNRERFYEKSGFQMGGAAAVSSSACMFILVIILVMFM